MSVVASELLMLPTPTLSTRRQPHKTTAPAALFPNPHLVMPHGQLKGSRDGGIYATGTANVTSQDVTYRFIDHLDLPKVTEKMAIM